jgi:hypothetical protein
MFGFDKDSSFWQRKCEGFYILNLTAEDGAKVYKSLAKGS